MMIAEFITALLAFKLAAPGAAPNIWPPGPNVFGPSLYRPADRSVSNWRLEALRHIDLTFPNSLAIATGAEPPRLPRCVRLNNYWCIKSARWNGEIATDSEGHVAFSSANEGAAVAAALLRRYYLEFNRKSALAIVSRWAPAQCFVAAAPARRTARTSKAASRPRVAQSRADALATRGIGSTLRARYLASKGRGGVKARRPVARSIVPDRPMPMMRAPSIAAGMGERPVALASLSLTQTNLNALGGSGGASIPASPRAPIASCAGENLRIRNYATNVIRGVAGSVDDDLRLFEADGTPTPSLPLVMANMAAVEIGPFRTRTALIDQVVATAARLAAEKRLGEAGQPIREGAR